MPKPGVWGLLVGFDTYSLESLLSKVYTALLCSRRTTALCLLSLPKAFVESFLSAGASFA